MYRYSKLPVVSPLSLFKLNTFSLQTLTLPLRNTCLQKGRSFMMDRSALMHLRDIRTEITAKSYLYPQQLDFGRQTSLIKLTYNQRNLIWMGNRSTIMKCVKNWRPLQHSWWRRLKGKLLHLITSIPIVMIFMAYRCKSTKKKMKYSLHLPGYPAKSSFFKSLKLIINSWKRLNKDPLILIS